MAGHVCPWWGGYFIDNWFRRLLHRPEKILAPYVQDGMTVIDIGCGMGFFSIPMARMVGDEGLVIAVDIQEKMLNVVKKRADRAGVGNRIRTHRCEPDAIGIDERADFVLAFWSAHEVPNARKLLEEVRRCLVEGGRFLVAEPRGHVSATKFKEMVATAKDFGLSLEDEPRITASRGALFSTHPMK